MAGNSPKDKPRVPSSPEKPLDVEKICFGNLELSFVARLLRKNGDFLLRTNWDTGNFDLRVFKDGQIFSWMLPVNRNDVPFRFEGRDYGSISDFFGYFCRSQVAITSQSDAMAINPVFNEPELIAASRIKKQVLISKGTISDVWKAGLISHGASSFDQTVALKVLASNANKREFEEFCKEVKTMRLLDHSNVIGILGVVKEDSQIGLLLDYMNGGTLKEQLHSKLLTNDIDILFALVDISNGLAYLHEHHLCHKNINSDHCLGSQRGCRRMRFVVAGFGMSSTIVTPFDTMSTRHLTIKPWAAPEVLRQRDFSTRGDVWDFGTLMIESFSEGQHPYSTIFKNRKISDFKQSYEYFRNGNRTERPTKMPPQLFEMFTKCSALQGPERPSMDIVMNAMTKLCAERGCPYSP